MFAPVQATHIVGVILWMGGALTAFSVLAVSVRELAARQLGIFEILAVRSCTALVILLTLLAIRSDLRKSLAPRRIGTHLLRNTFHFGSQYCWAAALTMMPLAAVFALEFTMPTWTILLAAWLLGERLTPSRIGVVVLGLIGVLVIVRPGIAAFNPATFLVLAAAFGFAITMIATKHLTATETTFGIVFWMMVIQLPMSLAGSDLGAFARLGPNDLLPVLGMGIAGTASHYCLSNAFRAGDATVVVPLDFLRVPIIAVVGWILYNEVPDLFVLLGALIIVAGVTWNLTAESMRKI